MTGISILIVDDDKLLVEKLKNTMKWERLNITAVFTAYNIRQARSLINEYPIHILLCDIDMPQGSGLELLEWIRESEKEIECLFLSSYANFAYAQMAVRLASRDYLLKPISNADLEQALARIVSLVQKRRKNALRYGKRPREEMWEDLLLCRVPESICIKEALDKEICLPEERFRLILVRVLETAEQKTENKDYAILDFAMRNISFEFFEKKAGKEIPEAIVHISNLDWMLVLKDQGSNTGEQTVCLREALECGNDRNIALYQGRLCPFAEIGKSRERLEYMEQNAVLSEDGILYEEKWAPARENYTQPPWEIWEREMLHTESLSSMADKIFAYLDTQMEHGGWYRSSMARFVRELVQMLYRYLNAKGFSYSEIFDDREFMSYERTASESESNVKEFILYLFEKLEGTVCRNNNRENVIQCLKDYIEQHLGENLSRTELAKEVYLSDGYISKIFLKETGVSLPNYIAERRIEKAKEYLTYSSLPVSKIATEVGYNNFSYFSKTFRDLTGCTPNEYRSKNSGLTKK